MPSRATIAQSLRTGSHILSLAAVLSASFGVGLIFGFQPPLMALVLERGGASSFEIGAVTSISTAAVMLCGPLYPSAIRRLGLRRAVILGIAISTVVLFAMPLLPGFQGWFALRFVTGCALGLEWIASEIWLNRLSTDQTRGTVMGTYATVFAAGVMAGPLLLQLTGTAGWRPFSVGALCLALTALPLLSARDPPAGDAGTSDRLQWLRIARAAPIVMLAALIAGLVESAYVSLLPVFALLRGLDEHSALALVTVFLAGNVILQLPIGRLGDRLGRLRVLALCAAVCVIGPGLLSAVMGVPWLVWPLLLLWGGTMYGFYTQGIALLGASYPHAELADANTVFVVVYCAGGIVGPSLGGLAMDAWAPNGLLVFLSVAPLLLAAGLLRHSRGRRA
ncbi:MAG TPA: MFS transporter [Steroidobacteraceae bacterium]|jgi:MFS family permease|nr:MFS transporter [Steroidobacteraceae bacterium]